MIDYKFNEGEILKELTEYVNKTYGQHYSRTKFQAAEFIIDSGHGEGFTIGNILKYAQRYGRKGSPEDWRKDLFKVIHYAIIALYVHDTTNPSSDAQKEFDLPVKATEDDPIAAAVQQLSRMAKVDKEPVLRSRPPIQKGEIILSKDPIWNEVERRAIEQEVARLAKEAEEAEEAEYKFDTNDKD